MDSRIQRGTKPPTPRQREALRLIADGRFYPSLSKEDDGWHARWRAIGQENAWVDEYVRSAAITTLTEDAEDQKHETLHDAWMMALRSRTGLVAWNPDECADFAARLDAWSAGAGADAAARRAIAFSFEASGEKFAVSCPVPRGRRALKALGQSVCVWSPLCGLASDGSGSAALRMALTRSEAEDFVKRGARDLRDAGYTVNGVDIAATVSAAAEVEAETPAKQGSAAPHARIRLAIKVAGETVSADEIRFLLDQGSSLVFFRDRWIEVDRSILKEALRALEKTTAHKANPIAFALGIGHVGRLEITDVRASGGLKGLVESLLARGGERYAATSEPAGFEGSLRGYQRDGVAWLRFLTENGFGALLADDMGLGKTVQVLAWLLARREADQPSSPALVVAPLTLLSNWAYEAARFAPGLRVYVHQGENRHFASGFHRAARSSDVVITSYSLLVKDYQDISETEWGAMILDEAQAVKNPDTRAAKAVRALTPPVRVALTGTPIENSVADLWSLEEFLNPGFLGDRRSFAERFARPVAADGNSAAARRLKRAIEPFLLRRLKTDPAIAAQIGDKREIREYCPLGPEECRAYESELSGFRLAAHTPGDAFALLTRLKLVCDGFDGEKVAGAKADRLAELIRQIVDCGESALVFTQYAKVGAALKEMLEERLGMKAQFLHGGLEAAARAAQVTEFQSSRQPAVLILSLRAGGVGLNLTKATHVIHYDRWWNPAVENQATDRAHRIGQSKTVFVHLFVAAGTIEERIDDILQRKESLRDLIADGQSFWKAALLRFPAVSSRATPCSEPFRP